jgi:hypothetical protein
MAARAGERIMPTFTITDLSASVSSCASPTNPSIPEFCTAACPSKSDMIFCQQRSLKAGADIFHDGQSPAELATLKAQLKEARLHLGTLKTALDLAIVKAGKQSLKKKGTMRKASKTRKK